jgi:23S rRNA pseudouridine1911/1915/1917 synthase
VEPNEEDWVALEVPREDGPARLDQWMAKRFPERSRSQWQKEIKRGEVRAGDGAVSPRFPVEPGQVLRVRGALLSGDEEPAGTAPEPRDIPLDVLHEDESILAVNKPAGLVVHPGNGCSDGTLVQAALWHCGSLPDLGAPGRPGVVHRLDKETSGVIVLAKTAAAGHELQRQFREREVGKRYLAAIQGHPRDDSGTVDLALGRHPVQRMRMAPVVGGRRAVTHWTLLGRFEGNWSLARARIETGRTHQIRVHFSAIGHPLLGDRLYGFRPSRSTTPVDPVPRVLLHAEEIRFRHPRSGRKMELEAPSPTDFRALRPG